MKDSATVKRQAQHIAKTSKDSIRLSENIARYMQRYEIGSEEPPKHKSRNNIYNDIEETESRYFVDHY